MRKATLKKLERHGESRARGELHPSAKLKEEDVLEIVQAVRSDAFTLASIARAFDITPTNVRAIMQGRAWSWLTEIQPTPKEK